MKNYFWIIFNLTYPKELHRNIFTEVKQRAVLWVIILFILSLIFLRPSQRNIFTLSEWYPFEICLSHSVSILEYLLKKFSVCFHLCCDIFLSYHFAGSWQLFDTTGYKKSILSHISMILKILKWCLRFKTISPPEFYIFCPETSNFFYLLITVKN